MGLRDRFKFKGLRNTLAEGVGAAGMIGGTALGTLVGQPMLGGAIGGAVGNAGKRAIKDQHVFGAGTLGEYGKATAAGAAVGAAPAALSRAGQLVGMGGGGAPTAALTDVGNGVMVDAAGNVASGQAPAGVSRLGSLAGKLGRNAPLIAAGMQAVNSAQQGSRANELSDRALAQAEAEYAAREPFRRGAMERYGQFQAPTVPRLGATDNPYRRRG